MQTLPSHCFFGAPRCEPPGSQSNNRLACAKASRREAARGSRLIGSDLSHSPSLALKTAPKSNPFCGAILAIVTVFSAVAEPADPGLEFFEKNIRPVFVERCYKCHSHDAEKIKGGLLLDTREGLLKG